MNTKSLFINDRRVNLPNEIYDDDASGFSGDISVSQLGTSKSCADSPWKIHGTEALPTTVLSISMYGTYEI